MDVASISSLSSCSDDDTDNGATAAAAAAGAAAAGGPPSASPAAPGAAAADAEAAPVCAICRATPSRAAWHAHRHGAPVHRKCLACALAADAFAPAMAWHDVVASHNNDANFRTDFERAKATAVHPPTLRAQPGTPAPPWNPHTVHTQQVHGMRVYTEWWAVENSDFQAYYQTDPAQVPGLQVTTSIPGWDGAPGPKHILFASDPADPMPEGLRKRRLEVYDDIQTVVIETVLTPMQQRRSTQAQDLFRSLLTASSGVHSQRQAVPTPTIVKQKVEERQNTLKKALRADLGDAVAVEEPADVSATGYVAPSIGMAPSTEGKRGAARAKGLLLAPGARPRKQPPTARGSPLAANGAPSENNTAADDVASMAPPSGGYGSEPELMQEDVNRLLHGHTLGCRFNGLSARIKTLKQGKQDLKAAQLQETIDLSRAAKDLSQVQTLSWQAAAAQTERLMKAGFQLTVDCSMQVTRILCTRFLDMRDTSGWSKAWSPVPNKSRLEWDSESNCCFGALVPACTTEKSLATLRQSLYDALFCEGLVKLFQQDRTEPIVDLCNYILDIVSAALAEGWSLPQQPYGVAAAGLPSAASSPNQVASAAEGLPSAARGPEAIALASGVLHNAARLARGLLRVASPVPGIRGSQPEDVDFVFPPSLKKHKRKINPQDTEVSNLGDLPGLAYHFATMLKHEFPRWQAMLQAYRMTAGAEMVQQHRWEAVQAALQDLECTAPAALVGEGTDQILQTAGQIAELRSALRPRATLLLEARFLQLLSGILVSVAEGVPSATITPEEALGILQTLVRSLRELPAGPTDRLMQDLLEQEANLARTVHKTNLSKALHRTHTFTSSSALALTEALRAFASRPIPQDVAEELLAELLVAAEFAAEMQREEEVPDIELLIELWRAAQKALGQKTLEGVPSEGSPPQPALEALTSAAMASTSAFEHLCQLGKQVVQLPSPVLISAGRCPSAEEEASMHHIMDTWHSIKSSRPRLAERTSNLGEGWKEGAASLLEIIDTQGHLKEEQLKTAVEGMRAAQVFTLTQAVTAVRKIVPESGWVKHATAWEGVVQEAQTHLFQPTFQVSLDNAMESAAKAKAGAISLCSKMEEVGCTRLTIQELDTINQALQHGHVMRFEGRLAAIYLKHKSNPAKLKKHVEHEVAKTGPDGTPVVLEKTHRAVRDFVNNVLEENAASSAPATVVPQSAKKDKKKRRLSG